MASRSLGSLTIDLIAKVGGFTAGLTQAEREADRRARNIKRNLSGLQRDFRSALAFLGGAALVSSIVRATAEAEKSFALLSNAVKATGGAAGYTADQLSEMAGDLQKVTTYSDDAIMGAQQLLLRFQDIQGVNFKGALDATLDLASALGKDLNSAATMVGKALANPAKGINQLARAGVVLEESQAKLVKRLAETGQAAEAQRVLLEAVKDSYGGAAEAARNNFAGALEGLKNAFGDLLEGKGGVTGATEAINSLADTLNSPEVRAGFAALIGGLLKVIEVAAEAAAGLAGFAKWVGESFAALANGAASGDLVRMSDEIIELQDEIKRLESLGGIGKALEGGGEATAARLENYKKQLRELQVEYDKAREAAEAMARGVSPGGTTPPAGSTGTVNPTALPSEEFEKVEAGLLRQIALYGQTGEAAKLAYEIQSGALADLSEQEKARLLDLAQQLDALGEQSVVTFETLVEQKFGRDGVLHKAVQETWTVIREELNETLATVGTDYEAVTEQLVEATEGALDVFKDKAKETSEFWLEASRNTVDILAGYISSGFEGSFKDVLSNFAKMLGQMASQAAAAQIGKFLFGSSMGSGGGFLGGLFGSILKGGGMQSAGSYVSTFFPGLADGGLAMAGGMYRVNEHGPELLSVGGSDYLMMGRNSGKVTPNNRLGGANVTMHIHGVTDADSFRRGSGQIKARLIHELNRSSTRDV